MLDVLAALAFAVFVVAALRTVGQGLAEDRRRRRINVFLAVLLVISFGTGLTQRELWPFSSWPLVAGKLDDHVTHGRIMAVDRAGAEHDVDYRAWQPLAFDELMAWMDGVFPKLPVDAKFAAARHLVSLAEASRQRVMAGQPASATGSMLGPAAAPYFILHPRLWTTRAAVPHSELVGLRYYRETWSLSARARGTADIRRELAFELPPATR